MQDIVINSAQHTTYRKKIRCSDALQTYITEAGGTNMVYLKIKRLIDIILSGLGLIILSPVFLVLILAIKVDSPGPVLFKQKRVGIHKSHNVLVYAFLGVTLLNIEGNCCFGVLSL